MHTPSSPRGLLAMRSFHPSPADRRDLTSCFDFWESDELVRRKAKLLRGVKVYRQSKTHRIDTLCKRLIGFLSSIGAAPVRYLGISLLRLYGGFLRNE